MQGKLNIYFLGAQKKLQYFLATKTNFGVWNPLNGDRRCYKMFVYGVMQSDGNSFCGDVAFDSFNMSYREEGSILDLKYEKQISWYVYYEDF